MKIAATGLNSSRVRASVAAILGTALLGGYAAQSFAADETNLEEVQVTGSRIKHTTDFDTANPTTVLDSNYFQQMGIVNVGDAVRDIPSNVSNNTPATTGNANFFTGSTIANLRGLNPFFGSRTLTLVDGQRFVPTNQGDGVDLNFIPTVLIDRMDIVTGGASAAYGSGAISGVENIFLNHTLQGGKVEADYGLSGHNDAKNRHIGAAFGTDFNDGRGHIVIGYEGQKSDALGCETARSWCSTNTGFVANPLFVNGATTPNQPQYVVANNLRTNLTSYNGVNIPFNLPFLGASTGAVANLNSTGNGLQPILAGTNAAGGANGSQGASVIGGAGAPAYQYTNLLAPVDRNVAALFVKYKLTDDINLKIDASYGKVQTTNQTSGLNENYTFVHPDNAYLSSATSAGLGNAGSFLSKDWNAQVPSYSAFFTRVARLSVGLDGRFGDSSWTWDGYYTYGDTYRTQLVQNNVHFQAYSYAKDSIIGPGGVPECRVTQQIATNSVLAPAANTNAWQIAQGCVPLNPFGTGAISPAAQAYSFGQLLESLTYVQQVAAFNTTGDLFSGVGAGAFKGAAGLEYRSERGNNVDAEPDLAGLPAAQAAAVHTDYLIQYGNSFSGKVQVVEGYVEADAPLLKDVAGAKLLDLDLSVRESHYDNTAGANTAGGSASNDLTTYKASVIWDPVDWLRARGSFSHDARAANFRELYYAQDIGGGSLFGYCPGTPGYPNPYPVADPCTWHLVGNAQLKPETSNTYTFGLVFTPADVLPGFQFAADYAHIKISNAIEQASVALTETNCLNLNIGCSAFTTYPGTGSVPYSPIGTGIHALPVGVTVGNIASLTSAAFNGAAYQYDGIDFTLSYHYAFANGDMIALRSLATYSLKQTFTPTPGAASVNILGQLGTSNSFLSDNQSAPRLQGNINLTYSHGPASLTGTMRYVSSGSMDYYGCTPPCATAGIGNTVSLSTNSVPSYQIFGLRASYKWDDLSFAKTFQLWGSVDNLFDKAPPFASGVGAFGVSNTNGGTNAVYYDTLGRYFRVGIRATF